MKTLVLLVFMIALALVVSCSGGPEDATGAVYTNGRSYTVHEAQPWVGTVATKDGKIPAIGSNADAKEVTDMASSPSAVKRSSSSTSNITAPSQQISGPRSYRSPSGRSSEEREVETEGQVNARNP